MKKSKNQSNESKDKIFDRIFKENAPAIFMPIIEREMGIKIKSYKPIDSELPRTIGRRVDFFCRIVREDGTEELLHIEFQTADDYEMVERVGEHHGIMLRKHRLPIRHIVIFLGKGKSRMRTELREEEIYRGFELVNISELDSSKLLSSQVPEEIILAILGNYDKEEVETILRFTIGKLKNLPITEAQRNKYLQQLLLLSKLRNLGDIVDKIIQEMEITYDYTQDVYYKRGIEAAQKQMEEERVKVEQQIAQEREKAKQEREKAKQEREKAKQEREKAKQEKIATIQSLLSIGTLSIAQIAEVFGVTEEFVEQIEKGETD